MLNTVNLEKRWFRYKVKSYIPHFIIAISAISIGAATFILLNPKYDNYDQTKFSEEKVTKQEVEIKSSPAPKIAPPASVNAEIVIIKALDESADIKIQSDEDIKLKPSLNFMQNMRISSSPFYAGEMFQKENAQRDDKKINKKAPKKILAPEAKIEEVVLNDKLIENEIVEKSQKKEQISVITIDRRETTDDIKNVIKRFKVNNNPALSLFVAKKYYELGDYAQAYNYALITNQINRDIEASWIIFTKSLVKLNKRDQAIQTLKDYIESSSSNTARILLEEIQSGKFK